MNIDQIEAIHAIVEKGSFRAAADHLHKSQPALSASVKNLEEEFGLEIFDRSSYRPTLTSQGEALLGASKRMLEAARYLHRVGRELGEKKLETKLRVSIDPLTPLDLIELIALECSRPLTPVMLRLNEAILDRGARDLLSGEADLAIGRCPGDASALESVLIHHARLTGVVSRRLLGHLHSPTREFLGSTAQILVAHKDVDEPSADLTSGTSRAAMGQVILAPDHATKFRMIEAGLGWGRLSLDEIAGRDEFVPIADEQCRPIDLELCLMRTKQTPLGPIGRAIWEAGRRRKVPATFRGSQIPKM